MPIGPMRPRGMQDSTSGRFGDSVNHPSLPPTDRRGTRRGIAHAHMRAQSSDKIGLAIRSLRLAKGWTLAELSDECGVPLSTLSRVELGQTALNSDKLVRLCRALDVDLNGLVAREAENAFVASGRRSVTQA